MGPGKKWQDLLREKIFDPAIRVEMIPGSGEVMKFKKNADEKVESLSYARVEFVRVK